MEAAAQYPRYPEKYSIPCYESNTPGSQYNAGERCPYTENEYAYVWDNNTPPSSVHGKSRMGPGGSQIVENVIPGSSTHVSPGKTLQEVPTYEPTKVRRPTGSGEHTVPQYYDVDPELAYKMAGVQVPTGHSQQGSSGDNTMSLR